MRKVLLATTALAAMGVTAAHADISISGNYEWEYTTNDTGTAWGDDGHINIKATNAADNGMTFTAVSVLTNTQVPTLCKHRKQPISRLTATSVQSFLVIMTIAAASAMDGALGRNNDIETQVGSWRADTALTVSVLTLSTCHQAFQASKLVCQKI